MFKPHILLCIHKHACISPGLRGPEEGRGHFDLRCGGGHPCSTLLCLDPTSNSATIIRCIYLTLFILVPYRFFVELKNNSNVRVVLRSGLGGQKDLENKWPTRRRARRIYGSLISPCWFNDLTSEIHRSARIVCFISNTESCPPSLPQSPRIPALVAWGQCSTSRHCGLLQMWVSATLLG